MCRPRGRIARARCRRKEPTLEPARRRRPALPLDPLTPDRVQKLKDARSEAAKEIEAYKAKKEEEYKKFESDVSGVSVLADGCGVRAA